MPPASTTVATPAASAPQANRLRAWAAILVSFASGLLAAVAQMPDFSTGAIARGGPNAVVCFAFVWLLVFDRPRREAGYAAAMREQRQHHKTVMDKFLADAADERRQMAIRLDGKDQQISTLINAALSRAST